MIITAEQCRAARALLNWSQDELEARSGVSKKTIADFEREAQIPYQKTLLELQFAFEAAGICLIPENGGGVGVRIKHPQPRLSKKRISRFDQIASFALHYRGRDYRVRLSTNILDDIDRADHSEAEMEKAFERHLNKIMVRAAKAIDEGRASDSGEVLLVSADFPEAV